MKDSYLDAGVRGWIVNTARKHYWKVAAWYEFDDLVQDGYLCYAKCRARFQPKDTGELWGFPIGAEPTDEDRRRFMAYLGMSFNNLITDLANRRTATPEAALASLAENQVAEVESWTDGAADLGEGSLASALAQAPAEILELLKQILVDGLANGPYQRTRLRKKVLPGSKIPRIVKGRRLLRETTEEHYDRCLGKIGVVAQLRSYFSPAVQEEEPWADRLVKCLFANSSTA